MARMGKQPVLLPEGVTAEVSAGAIGISGPKGTLQRKLPRGLAVTTVADSLVVEKKKNTKDADALQGTIRAHILNMVSGVTQGWEKKLEIVGAGYRAEMKDGKLVLAIGYSHPVIFDAPEGISFAVEKLDITVAGADREVVGQTAARIRAARPPDVYKGKGIRYKGEVVRKKPGKQAAKVGE
ncbi:50S ribosomal protein L6 [Candidatus Woesebacteria bacterium RIFCSPHIGHO2_01_FULL_44_10]|uniref:Large ribosomal subunit protein uL6 n=1 Tax=Candidatus Woesebacteria bacterium RIFCSPLOWO2_01_FULL_44_14 TaxID=1802525 RepID=A0A1F8C1W6_9BACT|nr:MAG: 50S ribosomal protein L6 [Candidatus Woesebacteria bacterium RIFCSPHIGHO2_01_FULL_44_10]OGM54729.1 MAG: 50S ribosomal protein L6 [Candidatus Woesebacteria bacterium RIFCSPHIGHO2_12_FULL_44_11]OGM70354.1 MAG: 50S ribosomal protein L6 [Candidatus Woesebacteria bacterium RIFCSPLOWO2_01_FULL_44_14]